MHLMIYASRLLFYFHFSNFVCNGFVSSFFSFKFYILRVALILIFLIEWMNASCFTSKLYALFCIQENALHFISDQISNI